jgi:glycosyltransferase involved in cell wall biosynthesis
MATPYVCAFRGRRDSYQAPLALAEGGLLDRFFTDIYALPWLKALAKLAPASVREKANSRCDPAIPADHVRCLWGNTFLEHLRHRLGCSHVLTFNKLDQNFSRAATQRAAEARTNLFLYSPYAWEAFTARYPHQPRKVLFQYHPHLSLEEQILSKDAGTFPNYAKPSLRNGAERLPEALARRERDCWKHADLIICASAFTRRSLLEAGANEKLCCVIPYGIEVPVREHAVSIPPSPIPVPIRSGLEERAGERRPLQLSGFRAIFVGTGCQRKGLHHLLLAWQRANLPADSRLTLVCRTLDRELEPLIAATPRVDVQRGISGHELSKLYTASLLFAMPSLVEGFGQVYLEAMAQGCPVLGTANTCLPDLGGESDGIFLVTPGNVEELTAKLEQLANLLPGNNGMREAARACAARFTWPAFRAALRNALATQQHI